MDLLTDKEKEKLIQVGLKRRVYEYQKYIKNKEVRDASARASYYRRRERELMMDLSNNHLENTLKPSKKELEISRACESDDNKDT